MSPDYGASDLNATNDCARSYFAEAAVARAFSFQVRHEGDTESGHDSAIAGENRVAGRRRQAN